MGRGQLAFILLVWWKRFFGVRFSESVLLFDTRLPYHPVPARDPRAVGLVEKALPDNVQFAV